MDKRIRSPNYPALSLPDAVQKVEAVYRNLHTHAAPREVVAKAMGYAGLNGASATAVSALHKYGLLERSGEEVKVTERALRILHPHSPAERAGAIQDAARAPDLFSELAERFPGRLPNEDLLRNYLVRKGFAPIALAAVISAYRDTSEMVEREVGGHNLGGPQPLEEEPPTVPSQAPSQPVTPASMIFAVPGNEKPIGRYDFEGGAYVRIAMSGDVSTEEALDMVETLIQLKRKEIERANKKSNAPSPPSVLAMENEEENS